LHKSVQVGVRLISGIAVTNGDPSTDGDYTLPNLV